METGPRRGKTQMERERGEGCGEGCQKKREGKSKPEGDGNRVSLLRLVGKDSVSLSLIQPIPELEGRGDPITVIDTQDAHQRVVCQAEE